MKKLLLIDGMAAVYRGYYAMSANPRVNSKGFNTSATLGFTMSLYDILSIGLNHQAVYYRREILQKYGFDESYKLIADLKSVVEPLAKDKVTITGIPEILAICEGGGVSKQRWRETLVENRRIIDEVIDPFYKNDYQRFARVNNEMLDDFIVLSHFHKFFPFLKLLTKMAKFFNDKFKHIPIE